MVASNIDTMSAVISASTVFFALFGCFGNLNIIIATWRNDSLRSNCGILIATLAFCDFWCLVFELVSCIRLLTGTASMSRTQCYWWITPYILILNLEIYAILAIAIDRLLAIQFALKYRHWNARRYIPLMILPGIAYTLAFYALGLFTLDGEGVEVCNPPSAYIRWVSELWNRLTVACCLAVVAFYAFTYIMLYKIAPGRSASTSQIQMQRKIVKTLTINVVAFVISSVGSSAAILLIGLLNADEATTGAVEAYAVIPGLASYALNYYIFLWRSRDYRLAFIELVPILRYCGFCLKSTNAVSVVTVTASPFSLPSVSR